MDIEQIKVGETVYDIKDANAQPKEPGKGLSTNDYSTEEKDKLVNIETGAQENVIEGVKVNGTDLVPDANKKVNVVIPDVSQFITRSVNDLVNYYLKSDTYTKQEVQALIAAINQFHYEVYESLSDVTSPASNVLYLIGPTGSGSDKYEEYVWPNATLGFVKIGDTSIDLSGYVTTTAFNTAIAGMLKYTDQTLTDEQKGQARTNIGAASSVEVSQLGQVLGSLIKEGSANISTSAVTDIIPTYQLGKSIPAGTKIIVIIDGKENIKNLRLILNQTELYIPYEQYEYTLAENLTSLRAYVPATQVLVDGANVKVHLYCYGIKQQLDELKQEMLEIPQNTKFATNEVLSETSIINEIGAGSEHDVIGAKYANELSQNTYNQVIISYKKIYNVKIGSGNTFVTQDNGLITFPVKKGDLVKIEPFSGKSVFFTLLSTIQNIEEGNTPSYIDGYQLIKSDTATSIVIPMDCFFCLNCYALNINTSSNALPKKLELYIPLKNNVSFSNLADTKTIYTNSATNSSTSTVYVVDINNIQVESGSTLRIDLSGIGVYSSYARLVLNDDSNWTMLVNGENVVKLTKDVTRIRVQLNKSQFIAEGTITANIEVDDIGNVLKEVIEATQKNLPITLTVQDLMDAAGTESNTFTESFEFNVKGSILKDSNVIFTCSAKYETSDADVVPYIAIDDISRGTGNMQKRSKGLIGGNGHYEIRQWRHPLLINSDTLRVRIEVPSGVSLTINTFSATTSNEINRDAFKVYGHSRGYWSYDSNARLSFELAAVSGYYGAIAVPKLTTDGVFVCYHDDAILSVNNNLQMKGGEPLTTELGALRMNELTYAQTQMLESINTNILGEHDTIPTLTEFFEICNKTGLHPCLSVHPYLTATELEQIKELAKEYNVLNRLTYKSSMDSTRASIDYSVFGNEIESYIYDTHPDQIVQRTGWLDAVGYDLTKITVGLELMGEVSDMMSHYSDIEAFKAKGYKLGLGLGFYNITDIQKFMKLGLYEWTVDNFFNNGLNW